MRRDSNRPKEANDNSDDGDYNELFA